MTSDDDLEPGLKEALITRSLRRRLDALGSALHEKSNALANAEAADRLSRHVAAVVARTIDTLPENDHASAGLAIVDAVLAALADEVPDAVDLDRDAPLSPAQVLRAILRLNPDGSVRELRPPLTPLLDTTLLTNSPGEPGVGHEIRAEIHSAEAIDVVMAFVRWSGIRPLLDALADHCREGKPLRLLTTTYTGSTELRALEELAGLGADVRVSYDVTSTRLHAKAWLFHRAGGYSTAYIGSSNLTHSAQVTGMEWNVRVSGVRNPDVVAKMAAVVEAYWQSGDFVPFDAAEFVERTATTTAGPIFTLPPTDVVLRPFQERLLERIKVARERGHHRNLLVAATGTGKTVMAAVDYARLRGTLPRDRLLVVAHRAEILEQSRATYRQAVRDAAFGELWVGGSRPARFEHVFASIQSLNAAGLDALAPDHFDVVVVDEFHHAAAPSYRALLERVRPRELLGLTATPERSDGLDVLGHFDGRIAAELRVWDAIDQHYLTPFAYFGVSDGSDLRDVGWRRGRGYDVEGLTNVLTADDAVVGTVLGQVRRYIANPRAMRALGFCVSVAHARFLAERFRRRGIPAVAVWGDSPEAERTAALRDLAAGRVNVVLTVDLFNEGVDVPAVDTLLLLRPTESPTLFLQQLGRGLRRSAGKDVCTVLDFVGTHRTEFRFDRRFRALLGGSRRDVERQVTDDFPFLPSGCHLELDPVVRDQVLRSLRDAIPSDWRAKVTELRELSRAGDVGLGRFLEESGLDVEDVYAGGHSWSTLRRAAGLPAAPAGPAEDALLRAVGRMLHVDDGARIAAYRAAVSGAVVPDVGGLAERERRLVRMLVGSLTTLRSGATLQDAVAELWAHPQVRAELTELLEVLAEGIDHVHKPVAPSDVPLQVHARYTRAEILAAFGVGPGPRPPAWQTGVWWEPASGTDLLAFTLDKSAGSFSPTTRYRDYAISRELIHWESQSTAAPTTDAGRRYLAQRTAGTNVALFARLSARDNAFWCLGLADYVSHRGERPIAVTWRLRTPLPGDLFAQFAAAVG